MNEMLKAIVDPKGSIVLELYEIAGCSLPDALLFFPVGACKRFAAAHQYDRSTGEWASVDCYWDAARAYERANPEVLEYSVVRWELEDIRATLEEEGIETSAANVREARLVCRDMVGWRDVSVEHGNEYLADVAWDIAEQSKTSVCV